jgi:hypothetical protein
MFPEFPGSLDVTVTVLVPKSEYTNRTRTPAELSIKARGLGSLDVHPPSIWHIDALLLHQMSTSTNDVAAASLQLNESPRDPCDEALSCGEIVQEIVRCFNGGGERPKRDLLSAALVNKIFLKPSLDILWHTMPSLGPFIALLDHTRTNMGNRKKV